VETVLKKALSPEPHERHPDGIALARDLSLCTNPRAWSLVHDLGSGWRSFAARHPLIALVPVNLPPFILAGAYNFWYNWHGFVKGLPQPVQDVFWNTSYFVNSILYPLGVALILGSALPVAMTLRAVANAAPVDPADLSRARRRSLALGHWVAAVGLVEWIVAGLTFPTAMTLLAPEFPAGWGFVHFFLSMLTCGLISCVFPFLATTWLAVRVFFPALLASAPPDPREQKQLAALGRQAGYYLPIAVVVPMLAVVLLLASGNDSRLASILLIVASVIGFVAAYVMYHRIKSDLAALTVATRPVDLLGTATDSVEGF
jgi:hypothetical protein